MATTQDEVDDACVAISARGERPTVERVRTELGGGSPNSLTPLVRAWKDAQRQPAAVTRQNTEVSADPVALPTSVQQVVDAATSALAAVGATLAGFGPAFNQAIAGLAEIERRRTRLEIEGVEAGAKARIAEAQANAEEERGTTDLIRQEVTDREAEIASLGNRLAVQGEETTARIDEISAERDRVSADLAEEYAQRAGSEAMARQADADARANAQRLREEIAALQAKLVSAGSDISGARVEAAAARSLAEAAQAEAERLREKVIDLTSKLEGARDEMGGLRTELAVARKGEEVEGTRAARAETEIERLRSERAAADAAARDAAARADADRQALRTELDALRARLAEADQFKTKPIAA